MNWLWKSSISRRLLGGFIVFLVPIVAVNLFFNYSSFVIVKQNVFDSYQHALLLQVTKLENNLKKFESSAYALAVDQDINALNQSPNNVDLVNRYEELVKRLVLFSSTNELDGNIAVVTQMKGRVISSSGQVWVLDRYPNIMEKVRMSDQAVGWIYQPYMLPVGGQESEVISFVAHNQQQNGVYVIVDIPTNSLKRELSSIVNREEAIAFLRTADGNMLYSTKETSIQDIDIASSIMEDVQQGHFELNWNDMDYQVIYHTSEYTGITLGMMYPLKTFMQPILQSRYLMYSFVIVLGLLVIVYTFLTYRRVLAPTQKLINAMQNVSKGNFDFEIDVKGNDEFSFMYHQFNRMTSKINTLVNEVYIEKLKQQQVQLKLLQSQINPHFLYNCLNMNYQMAKSGNVEGASEMSLYLGRYFRYATKSNKDIVTMKEELENVETYLKIQKIQYEDKFEYEFRVPEHLANVEVPRLSIQPIVENAFVHGIEADEKTSNHLVIYTEIQDHVLLLIVENDGKTPSDSDIERIQGSLAVMNIEESGVGLNNTHWRLRLKYGEQAGLHMEPRKGGGTKVFIHIPYLQPQDGGEIVV